MKTLYIYALMFLSFLIPFSIGNPLNWTTTLGVLCVFGIAAVHETYRERYAYRSDQDALKALREQVDELEKRVNSLQTVTSMRTAFRGGKRGEA